MSMTRRLAVTFSVFLAVSTATAQSMPASQPPFWAAKPDVVAFDKAQSARLDEAQVWVKKVVDVQGPRTVANTLAPYDEAVQRINSAAYAAVLMQHVNPDATFRDHATAMVTKANAASLALGLNGDVYKALSCLDLPQADAATRHYVERVLLQMRLSGVDKDEATRNKLKALNDKLTDQSSMFDRNIADGQLTIEATVAELDGLPQDYLDHHKPDANGKVHITTNYPDYFPVMTFAKNNNLRTRAFDAFQNRAYPKNRDLLMAILQTRYEIATLLGYSSWADYNAANAMIVKGQNIADFIQQVDAAARPLAEKEFAMLVAEKQKLEPGSKEIKETEASYISELMRRSQYDFDSQSVRPYLPYAKVKQGVLDTASQLFHVTFKQEPNAPVWDPTVETWDVIDHGKAIGRFYLDMHPREGKFSHAEMVQVLDGVRGKQLPEATLVCNFPMPAADDPGLMDYDDVETFFHEFGHLVHWILGGQQQWAGVNGAGLEGDFVEAPSQMLEEWMHSHQVLATFAKHYKTGEPIPADLVTRMNRASAFGRGAWVLRQNQYTALSYEIYKGKPEDVDLDKLARDGVRRYTLLTPHEGTHMYTSFGHLASYSSAYYTYLWDKVIAEDFFRQFNAGNLLTDKTSMRYRRQVLEPGGTMSANDLVKTFLGRPQNMEALKGWMAEEFVGPSGKAGAQ